MNDPAGNSRLLEEIVEEIYTAYPFLIQRYGENGKIRTREDNQHHLNYLQTAYEASDKQLFVNYTIWLHELLSSRGMNEVIIMDNFERLQRILKGKLPAEQYEFYADCLRAAIDALR